ncbi:MAG: CRISPR-associated protein Cas4 [Thermoprotei archaeon]|nr:MAG: CRISPR-associated protein Cas4 [Thermoprotei archaeon]
MKQYAYCPMIPWIAWNYGVREPETYSMKLGKGERESRLKRLRKLKLEPPIRLDVEMYSPRLRMAGVADAVAGSRRLTVAEVKLFKRRKYRHFKAQLMAYALLSEECLGPTYRAILVLGFRVRAWDVDRLMMEETERIVTKVRETVESEKPPIVQHGEKCSACWYHRLCPAT